MTSSSKLMPSSRTKVVLVDDDPTVLSVHAEMLKERGFIPFTFECPEEALEYLREHGNHVDMVITDYRMPSMNGLDLIGLIREFDCNLPGLILSGFSAEVDSKKAEQFNVKVIAKPVRMKVLMGHIQSCQIANHNPVIELSS